MAPVGSDFKGGRREEAQATVYQKHRSMQIFKEKYMD